MAEFLIKAVDATHADPVKDLRGCYKRGDIVAVRPDGFEWGRLEALPPAQGGVFVRVRITGVTVEQVATFIKNRWNVDPDGSAVDVDGNITRRRVVRVIVDNLPTSVRNTLNTTGFYSTTWTQIKNYVHNKVLNEAF